MFKRGALILSFLAVSLTKAEINIPLTEDKPELPRNPKTGFPTSPYPANTPTGDEQEPLPDAGGQLPPEAQIYAISPDTLATLLSLQEGIDTTLQMLRGLTIASFPKVESLKAIKFIKVHPYFQSVLMFDKEVIGASASFSTTVFRKQGNIIIVQPDPSVQGGNITVLLKDPATGKPFASSIVVRKLNPYMEGKKKDVLYLFYYFADREILSPVQVLEEYRRIYGHYPSKEVETFFINGVAYKIMEDEVHGEVRIGKKTYRVEVVRLK